MIHMIKQVKRKFKKSRLLGMNIRYIPAEEGRMALTQDSKSDSLRSEFDSDDLLDRIEGDRALFIDILRIFLDDTPKLISELESAVKSGNADGVEKAAHAIKGSCAMVSAKRLEGLAHHMETMGRNGNLKGSSDLCREIIQCFQALNRIMTSFLKANGLKPSLESGV
jgi:HPt (histidine-containing phosphotransfer) domain-containing protein